MNEQLKILQSLRFSTGEVTSCDFNGNYLLAVGLSDRNVRVFEWKMGLGFVDMSYSPLSFHKYGVTSVRFSPRGIMLASSSLDGTTVLYKVQTGAKIFLMIHPGTCSVRYCEFTHDSTKLITAGDNGTFCFWDLIHRSQIRNCQLHDEDFCVKGLAVSPNSEYLLSADSGGFLKLWFIGKIKDESPQCIFSEKNVHDGVLSCDFSPVRQIVGSSRMRYKYFAASCGADSLIKIWNIEIETEECSKRFFFHTMTYRTLKGHTNDVISVRFNSSGQYLLSTGMDNTVRLWQVSTGNIIENLEGYTRFTICSAFSKNSTLLATGSNDKNLIIWNLDQNLTLDSQIIEPCNVSSHFTSIDLIDSWTEEKEVEKTEKYSNEQFNTLQTLNSSTTFNSVYLHSNNLLVVGGGDKTLTAWRRKDDKLIFEQKETLKDLKYSVSHLDVSTCGTKVISCSLDKAVIFWDLNMDLTYNMRTPKCTGGLRTCRFSNSSQFIAAAGDNQHIFLWDANNLEFIKTIQHHEGAITSVAFTPDSKFLVSTCSAGDIKLYCFENDKCCATIKNAQDLGATCCDISNFAIPQCQRTNLCSFEDGLQYSEGYLLATCGNDGLIKLWQLIKLEICALKSLSGHRGAINYVRFSSNEPLTLASCGTDGTVRIWDVRSGNLLQILNVHQNAVTTCSFSPDSSLLATGSLDKTVVIWSLTKQTYPELMKIIQNSSKAVENWTAPDVADWFFNIGYPNAAKKIIQTDIDGKKLLSGEDDLIISTIGLEKRKKEVRMQLHWLREETNGNYYSSQELKGKKIPHTFLCPITHEIMKDPVICSDGYTYEEKAIIEWFLTGEFSSPVTQERLKSTKLMRNYSLKINICTFLFAEDNEG